MCVICKCHLLKTYNWTLLSGIADWNPVQSQGDLTMDIAPSPLPSSLRHSSSVLLKSSIPTQNTVLNHHNEELSTKNGWKNLDCTSVFRTWEYIWDDYSSLLSNSQMRIFFCWAAGAQHRPWMWACRISVPVPFLPSSPTFPYPRHSEV